MKIFKYFVRLILLICLSVIIYGKFLERKWNGSYDNPKTSSTISNSQITSDKAIQIVTDLPEVKEWRLLIAKSDISTSHVAFEDFNNLDINEKFWNIHVFEEFPDHRATFNWYEVDKQTGDIKSRVTTFYEKDMQ